MDHTPNPLADKLRALADWAQDHAVTTAIDCTLYTEQPTILVHEDEFARLFGARPYAEPDADGWLHLEQVVDGVTVKACYPVAKPIAPPDEDVALTVKPADSIGDDDWPF